MNKGHPCGTHIPILLGLSRIFEIKSVIEFGCSQYSTPIFLNHFPHLEKLTSIDNKKDYLASLEDDKRLEKMFVEGVLSPIVADMDNYDLVFVDDSDPSRPDTISEVIKHFENSVLVFHDADYITYKLAMQSAPNLTVFDTYNPPTGVSCDEDLTQLQRIIFKHRYLSTADIEGWLRVYES